MKCSALKKILYLIVLSLLFNSCERGILQYGNEKFGLVDPSEKILEDDIDFSTPKIIYTSNQDNTSDIYIMDIDGKNKVNLTQNSYNNTQPRISPDGSKLAYLSDEYGRSQIQIINFSEKRSFRLTDSYDDIYYFNFSADGQKIYYSSLSPMHEFYIIDAENGNEFFSGQGGHAELSMDGSKVVFSRDGDIYDYEFNEYRETQLTSTREYDFAPIFSPDAKQIAFLRGGQLLLMNSDGSFRKQLSKQLEVHPYVQFHPEGINILFTGGILPDNDIYTVNLFGAAPVNLTTVPNGNFEARYSSKGSKIVFASERDGNSNIYLMDRDGKNLVQLTDSPAREYQPEFLPGDF